MEGASLRGNQGKWVLPNDRLFVAIAPMVLISVGYIDPGKWVSCVDSGARFGGDLVPFLLVFNFVAILCHFLSARIGVITGRSLTQICCEEYDKLTCIFLGVQAELSVICLDLTMILGIAHGLNMIFGADLFTCVLLTALNAALYPLFSTLLESSKVKFLVICMAGIVLLCYVLGMLSSLSEFPVSSNGWTSKLSGESAFALMSLLGANVMPHNFYLYSSLVQQYQVPPNVSRGMWLNDSFIVTLIISSGIFLVNYVLINFAASTFYSNGLSLLTLQDSISLLDQAYKRPLVPFASFVILLLANQISALSWEFSAGGRDTMLHEFFNMDLPEWLHRATVRIFAVVLALYSLWYSGAEGMYHVLICTQVIIALLLPSSVIPLFRVASSRPIMGLFKISPILEFLLLLIFIGMLGLEIMFVVEMLFGESDWVSNLRWNIGNSTSITYVLLLLTACFSVSFMLWLAATPLKSASTALESQPWNWDAHPVVPESCIEREENDVLESRCYEEEPLDKEESLLSWEKSFGSQSDLATTNYDFNLPETIMDTIQEQPSMATIDENSVVNVSASLSQFHLEPKQPAAFVESVPVTGVVSRTSDVQPLESDSMKPEASDPVEKTLRIEGDCVAKGDEGGDTWEPDDSSKDAPSTGPPATPEGPGSFRSLSGKSDEGGASAGSLSRLSGLGRAARRQLAAALDEFWGQLYDFHGQITHEAKAKKFDQLLGVDSKPSQSLTKADSAGKDFGMQIPSLGGRVSDNLMNLNLYDTPNQQNLQNNIESAYRAQRGSAPLWSNQMQLLEAYMQSSNRATLDAGERRYQSLRLPPSSEGLECQPATIHGYQFASYLNRIAKDRSDYINGQLESLPQKSPSFIPNNYRESLAFALGQKSTNGFNNIQPSSYQNLAVQRNSMLQSDKQPYYELGSARPVESIACQNNTKKYHSLPDISGHSVPLRNLYLSDRNANIPNTSVGFGTSVGQATYEPSYSSTGSRAVAPLAFDELSPSRAYSMRLSSGSDTGSLWSKQPFEQFGVANKTIKPGAEGVENKSHLTAKEPLSLAEMESKLLQSLRFCILKLLKLEGSEWLFKPNDGVDEDLIDRVAARERFLYEVESQDVKQASAFGDCQYSYSDRKPVTSVKGEDSVFANLVSSVPQCGEDCVWKVDLVVSFGVWCIRRILELSLMESRPELWGKYTYVLNRLQGVIDLAFFKSRTPMSPCFCLQIPASYQMRSSPHAGNGMLPPTARPAKSKVTTASMLLDVIKDVEIAISCRKGRSGTAAGDVAFPKGKENLASVLKRYKRRLSNKPIGSQEGGPCSRKHQSLALYGS